MYKSPIDIITEDVKMKVDNGVYEAVAQYGIKVDRDELLKALSYDRNQYDEGFKDGYGWRESKIVRCKDCMYYHAEYSCLLFDAVIGEHGFCSFGTKRDDNKTGYDDFIYRMWSEAKLKDKENEKKWHELMKRCENSEGKGKPIKIIGIQKTSEKEDD